MKIISAKGQTCNKFWIYTNHIAESFKTNERLVILVPDISIKDYPNLYNYTKLQFPLYSPRITKFIGYDRYINILNIILENKFSLKFLEFIFYFIPDVNFIVTGVSANLGKNQGEEKEKIINLFSPNLIIQSEVLSIFKPFISDKKIICGVHIRRGDYSFWRNGKYLYTNHQYHTLMQSMIDIFAPCQIIFFISSNENINLNEFPNCNCFNLPGTSASKDLFALSLCNYIIGPPSTFSAWASFYGNNQIYFIEDPNEEFSLSSFQRY